MSSTTQPPAATAPAGRDLPDKATPVLAAIAREQIASRLPDADPRKTHRGAMHHRRHESTRGQPAPRRDTMSQPACPDPARALSARDWPAPAPPAHPQHRSPAW
jgi:hypothetical protein